LFEIVPAQGSKTALKTRNQIMQVGADPAYIADIDA
jgi:hypothetical protein